MARAVVSWREAEQVMDTAETALIAALDEAALGAPEDPGTMAQFLHGLEEGVTGIVEGTVALGVLAARLTPQRLAWDPQGWLDDHEIFWGGVGHAIANPVESGKALIDLDTLRESPARWAGKITPELIAAIYTVGGASVAGRAGTFGRLRKLADDIDVRRADGGVYPPVSRARIRARLDQLGHPRGSPAAYGAELQLRPPYGAPDFWIPTTLQPVQRFARVGEYLIPVDGPLPASARELFESIQLHPTRRFGPDGDVPQPTHPDSVQIYEVQQPIDAARADAVMNLQFGAGDGTKISVGDLDDVLDGGHFAEVPGPEGVHRFDPDTVESRIEDPEFAAVDETLPDRALDPDREAARTGAHAGAKEARDYPIGPAATAAADNLAHDDEPQPVRPPDHQGAR